MEFLGKKEIRMVLVGTVQSGKSTTANTILGKRLFHSSISLSSVTKICLRKSAVRFDQNILVVDTPGIQVYDTTQAYKNIEQEIPKWFGLLSPGPHAIILVLGISRFTKEEQNSIQHIVNIFGENFFKYSIVLFTGKDHLDYTENSLEDFIKLIPRNLQEIINKSGNRVIAFNNGLKGEEGDKQVEDLLSMIINNVHKKNSECYSFEMYLEAQKLLEEKEAEKFKHWKEKNA